MPSENEIDFARFHDVQRRQKTRPFETRMPRDREPRQTKRTKKMTLRKNVSKKKSRSIVRENQNFDARFLRKKSGKIIEIARISDPCDDVPENRGFSAKNGSR